MENRHVKIEYVNVTWQTMLHFNTTRAGVVQALLFASNLEQRMLFEHKAENMRISVTNEILGYDDTRFVSDGPELSELLETAWRYGFAA